MFFGLLFGLVEAALGKFLGLLVEAALGGESPVEKRLVDGVLCNIDLIKCKLKQIKASFALACSPLSIAE